MAILAVVVCGCGVRVDLSDLQFEKPEELRSVDDDEAAMQDLSSCDQFYHCIFSDGQSADECLDLLDDGERAKAEAVEACRVDTCGESLSDPDSVLSCLLGSCTKELVACSIGGGDMDCFDFGDSWNAWFTGEEECDTTPELLCVIELLGETSSSAADAVTKLYKSCLTLIYASPTTGMEYEKDCRNLCGS